MTIEVRFSGLDLFIAKGGGVLPEETRHYFNGGFKDIIKKETGMLEFDLKLFVEQKRPSVDRLCFMDVQIKRSGDEGEYEEDVLSKISTGVGNIFASFVQTKVDTDAFIGVRVSEQKYHVKWSLHGSVP